MGLLNVDFEKLTKENKTLVYKETKDKIEDTNWFFWSKKKNGNKKVYIYWQVVDLEDID